MKAWEAVAVDSALWAAWGALVGLVASKLPDQRFANDGPLTRLRPWERDGRLWAVVGLRRWKRFVPEVGWLTGSAPEEALAARRRWPEAARDGDSAGRSRALGRLLASPRDADMGPAWIFGVMVIYGLCANVPCIIIQRYNRGRLLRVANRHAARPASLRASPRKAGDSTRKVVG